MIDFKQIINKNKKDIIVPTGVLLIICLIIPLALAITNNVTAARIANLQIENQNKAMSSLIQAKSFKEENGESESGSFSYYIAENNGKEVGYIFICSEKGYGGDIGVMTAVNPDGTVKAVSILDASNETPGLGQNVTKESFYSQYKGKTNGISVLKNGAVSENNEVDAVTGATISSKAVNRAINKALSNFKALNIIETEVG